MFTTQQRAILSNSYCMSVPVSLYLTEMTLLQLNICLNSYYIGKKILQLKTILIMAFMHSQQNNHYFQMHSNWMDCVFPFIIAFLMSKELKRCSVIGSLAFQCSTFTQLTFWGIVIFIKRHICSKFPLKCFSGEKDLATGRMFVITVISVVLLEELATLFSITLWVFCACVCVSVLRMFSHSYQCVLGCASAPAFY